VPFTSFQEWTVEPDPETGKKKPHWFSIPSPPIGTFAGISSALLAQRQQ
jgi:putative SOS response-associated peptidase YedK